MTFKLIGNRIFAKKSSTGWTIYEYDKEKLVAEIWSGGVVGTYNYDRHGRFDHIALSNGQTVIATYSDDGTLNLLSGSNNRKVRFKGKREEGGLNDQNVPSSLIFQKALTYVLGDSHKKNPNSATTGVATTFAEGDPICQEGGSPENCVVESGGGGSGGDSGGDSGGGGFGGDSGGTGGEGGNGSGGGASVDWSSPYNSPASCKIKICEVANEYMVGICRKQPSPRDRANCYSVSNNYYGKCQRSCETEDWRWLEDFVFPYY